MSPPSDESDEANQTHSCKIDRTAAAYDLPGEAERLAEYWTRDTDRYSLRELAVYFNRRLLRAAMEQAGLNPLDGEVENTHRLLTDDDVSPGMRTQARNQLQRHGVDIETVRSDFVSYQTVRRHLKQCLGAERAPRDSAAADTSAQRIAALQHRTVAVTENTLSQLQAAGNITYGDIDVFVDITVSCAECGRHATIQEFITNDGCHCEKRT